jgi:hypothetical protein
MTLAELLSQVPQFDSLPTNDKICLFGWYLQTFRHAETFGNSAIRDCFRQIDAPDPQVSVYLPRMAARKPPLLVRVRGEYKLEGSLKRSLDAKYGIHQHAVIVTKLLSELPTKIPNLAERAFMSEAINCYKVKAYRASIVMTWNLAFDHLLNWVVADSTRLTLFNKGIPIKYPKRTGYEVAKTNDFEEFKEAEVIEVCRTANILSKNTIEILREKLKRRNIAAHPSQVAVTQSQADDVITDLVNNVILVLS